MNDPVIEKNHFDFDVFGQRMRVERRASHWYLSRLSSDGKSRPVKDIAVPSGLPVAELAGFLDDMYHEYATPERPVVVPVGQRSLPAGKQEEQ